VFGVAPAAATLPASALAAFARAGSAQPVELPATGPTATDPNALFDQCAAVPGWASDFARTGKPAQRGQSIADYSATGGSAVVHSPASERESLLAELRSQLVAERPCSFELSSQGLTASDLTRLEDGAVLELDGTPVARDAQDGWQLVGASRLELAGASCTALRAAAEPALELRWACSP
jgi:hypothetical protein